MGITILGPNSDSGRSLIPETPNNRVTCIGSGTASVSSEEQRSALQILENLSYNIVATYNGVSFLQFGTTFLHLEQYDSLFIVKDDRKKSIDFSLTVWILDSKKSKYYTIHPKNKPECFIKIYCPTGNPYKNSVPKIYYTDLTGSGDAAYVYDQYFYDFVMGNNRGHDPRVFDIEFLNAKKVHSLVKGSSYIHAHNVGIASLDITKKPNFNALGLFEFNSQKAIYSLEHNKMIPVTTVFWPSEQNVPAMIDKYLLRP